MMHLVAPVCMCVFVHGNQHWCHTKRRIGWLPNSPSFGITMTKNLKTMFFAVHVSISDLYRNASGLYAIFGAQPH